MPFFLETNTRSIASSESCLGLHCCPWYGLVRRHPGDGLVWCRWRPDWSDAVPCTGSSGSPHAQSASARLVNLRPGPDNTGGCWRSLGVRAARSTSCGGHHAADASGDRPSCERRRRLTANFFVRVPKRIDFPSGVFRSDLDAHHCPTRGVPHPCEERSGGARRGAFDGARARRRVGKRRPRGHRHGGGAKRLPPKVAIHAVRAGSRSSHPS